MRDVVQLEVQENIEAHAGDLANVVGAVGGEQLEADLDPTERAAQLAQDGRGRFAGGDVEGQDQVTRHLEKPLMDTNGH